jgi:hypothetical protein
MMTVQVMAITHIAFGKVSLKKKMNCELMLIYDIPACV